MNSSGASFFSKWGLWLCAVSVIVMVALLWCQGVNRKLRYILERLDVLSGGKGQGFAEYFDAPETGKKFVPDRSIPPLAALCIIGIAILVLFVLPIWLINQ